VVEAGQG